jgi:ribosomal protein L11
MQETLNEAADYVRRINQVLVVRLTQMKKSHDLTGHKMAVLKLLYQQAKQETGSALKEMRKIMDRMGEQVKQMAEKKEEKIEPKKVS